MLQWFNLGFHYREGFIMYGQLLNGCHRDGPTEPDVYCWVHYRTSLLTQRAENTVQGMDLE